MPEVLVPPNATGPYGEPIVSVTAPANTTLHLPPITYYGRAGDLPRIQAVIDQQIPSLSILTLAALQSYQLAGARIAIVIQYDDPALPDNDAGLSLWASNNGTVVTSPTASLGGVALYDSIDGVFVLDPSETYDIVLVLDAQNLVAGYGLSNNGAPSEVFSANRAFYITLHEVLHPRRGGHQALDSVISSGQSLTAQFVLDRAMAESW